MDIHFSHALGVHTGFNHANFNQGKKSSFSDVVWHAMNVIYTAGLYRAEMLLYESIKSSLGKRGEVGVDWGWGPELKTNSTQESPSTLRAGV